MSDLDVSAFPRDFAWGAATAAYQIEGTVTFTLNTKINVFINIPPLRLVQILRVNIANTKYNDDIRVTILFIYLLCF